ncbi:MAG TPA: hypothetical protein VMT70_22080 [Vicinamibacteria bacterium]|nr:hypothetical protein [Vicinamibacteria bacterium]
MKLNPLASSSDLDVARETARRLHMRRRRGDHGAFDAPVPPLPPAALAGTRLRPEPVPPTSPRVARSSPLFDPAALETPPPPSWDEPVGEAPPRDERLRDVDEPALGGAPSEEDVPLPDVDVEGPSLSPDEMVGSAEPVSGLEDLAESEPPPVPPSPFEIDLDDAGPRAEDLVGASALPSWDDVVRRCLDVSQARAAMLVDPAGQVFAAQGDWPSPGPDMIAAKLVSTMDRTLKDAPTRSIQAPLAGRHLTAWRVPLSEGLVTIAFLGDAPVRTETRPGIDTEIHRGAGA